MVGVEGQPDILLLRTVLERLVGTAGGPLGRGEAGFRQLSVLRAEASFPVKATR